MMYRFQKYKIHYKETLKLALPIVISQLGYILVQFADNVMVGQYGGDDPLPLAAVSFGVMTSLIFFLAGQGLTLGLTPLIGELYAQKDKQHCASYLKHSLVLFPVLGIIIVCLQLALEPMLYQLGQPVEVVDAAIPYYRMMAYSIFPVLLFSSFKNFLDGVGNTFVPMVIMMICNAINIFLNWVYIGGNLGAPELGVEGAALATLISRICMPILGAAYFIFNKKYRSFTSLFPSIKMGTSDMLALLKMGGPISAQMSLESLAFIISGIMMGWFTTAAIGANQIANTLANTSFMIVLALGTAVTIRVSHFYGKRDVDNMSLTAKATIHLVLLWNISAALVFTVFRNEIPLLFTTNEDVLALASQMLIVVACFQIFDALQCAGVGIMRGFQDVKMISWLSLLAYIVLNIPVGYLCGITLGMGPVGLFVGYIFGLGTAAILYLVRIKFKLKSFRRTLTA
jgi:MATE family multidrug resistance protein